MFVFLPFREYEDRELRIARERDRKRLEFTNQLQRINNQLEYEKSRDTQGMPRSRCVLTFYVLWRQHRFSISVSLEVKLAICNYDTFSLDS